MTFQSLPFTCVRLFLFRILPQLKLVLSSSLLSYSKLKTINTKYLKRLYYFWPMFLFSRFVYWCIKQKHLSVEIVFFLFFCFCLCLTLFSYFPFIYSVLFWDSILLLCLFIQTFCSIEFVFDNFIDLSTKTNSFVSLLKFF